MIDSPPRIDNAPGLRWRKKRRGWVADLVLRHRTSKRGKKLTVNLRLAPMVMDELRALAGIAFGCDALVARGLMKRT